MLNLRHAQNSLSTAALIAVLLISMLAILQGFHHHHSEVEEQACSWHNGIQASILLAVLSLILGLISPQILLRLIPEHSRLGHSRALDAFLLNLPPPATA